MRCCVPGCKNDSRHLSKSQGITFHVFPVEANLRRAWQKAIGKEGWEPKERSTVCSDHFHPDDLYHTKTGLRKVKNGAVPIAVQDTASRVYTDPTNLVVCRICLTTDGKLYNFKEHQLGETYEQLTGVILAEEDQLPKRLCLECAYRLNSCNKFRAKSLKANTVLNNLVEQHDFLTTQLIKTIDRQLHHLNSTLSYKHLGTDHYDLTLEHIDNSSENIEDIEIKDENQDDLFLNENEFGSEPVNNEALRLQEDCQEIVEAVTYPIVPEPPTEELPDELSDDEEHPDVDLGFSSDDSIPLQLATKAKQKRPKTKLKKESSTKKVRRRQTKPGPAVPKVDRRRKPFLNSDLNETLFTITDLTVEEQVAEILKRQESANYKNAVYKCTECYKGFLDEEAYSSHMSRHTKECGEYKCNICKTHFKHQHALRKHITAHHTQRFNCTQCPYVTTHRQTARLHERWHKGTKYQCPHCPDEFVKFTTYMGHIRIKHPSDFVCALCGFSFVSEKGIELHKKLKHRIENIEVPEDGPMCEVCNVRFVTAEAHEQHLRVSARHHSQDNKDNRESNKPKKSRNCKTKMTKDRSRMSRANEEDDEEDKRMYPSQMRKAEGPIPCEQCGIQLEDSRAYHGHFRRVHPDKNRTNYPSMKSPCMCEVCGRMFQSHALLRDHRWVHTGERPFKCEQCGKSFRMKQRLVAHRRVHSSVKASYMCNLCGKHFSTHSNRQRHMFIHTGLKPFKCEMCGKSFKHSSEKRAHITYVHLKKPWPKRSRGKRRQDTRQSAPGQQCGPNSGSEAELPQPLWPCGQKMEHINTLIEDKPMYYNLKI